MSLAHLSEWQRRSFDISSGTYTPEQKADAYRAHILDIQYAWASGDLSPATTAILLRTYTECYAMVLDSDDPVAGLNNYAESVLHLARGQKNESSRWKSLLTVESALVMPCVRRMLQARSTPMGSNDAHVVVGEGVGENGSCSSPEANMGGLFSKSEARTSFGSGSDVVCSLGTVPPSPFCAPSGAFPSAQPGVAPLFGNAPPAHTGNHSEPNSYPAGAGSSHSHQSVFFPSSSNPSKRKFHSSAMEISRCSFPGPLAQEPQSGGLGNRGEEGRTGNFKTAREQLIMEHQKKQSQQPQRAGLSSGLKKSLGANRPRGTFSKFVSPLPRQEDSRAGGAKELLPVDERLKNFEPKIIELILSEIMDHGPPVSWDDIAGLEFAKATIKEIVVWPMLRPDIFTGLRGPPKGILLFGPPGTGKTLIGKCIACQSGATFFSISASSLTSKWVGEGEKMVRALFTIARCHQPSVIFIDEIDSLLSQRTDGEHDSSRRIKTEFLVQLDGATTSANDRVLVVGATNRPQEIDEAARRRLAKRLYVPLPDASARRQIVVSLMAQEKSQLGPGDLEQVVAGSKGFSGADMTQLCREAALGPIRSIWVTDIATISPDQVRPILHVDFLEALKTVRPSVSPKDLELYEDWNRTYGCGR